MEHIQNIIGRDQTEQSEDCISTHTQTSTVIIVIMITIHRLQLIQIHSKNNNILFMARTYTIDFAWEMINTATNPHWKDRIQWGFPMMSSNAEFSWWIPMEIAIMESNAKFIGWIPMVNSHDGFQWEFPMMESNAAEWTCSEFECHTLNNKKNHKTRHRVRASWVSLQSMEKEPK